MAHVRLSTPAERARSGVLAALVVAGIGYGLLNGLAPGLTAPVRDALKVFGVAPPPPPPPEERPPAPRQAAPKKEGRASPPNLKAKPVEIVQPPPVVPLPVPPPVVAAPKAGPGPDPSAGAATISGPGFGSGGIGNGTGSGGRGNGEGGGGGREAELLTPQLKISQLSRQAQIELRNIHVTVEVNLLVGIKGRVTNCEVGRSSGHPIVDSATCDLVIRRFRFRPELDANGRPTPVTVTLLQGWSDVEVAAPGPGVDNEPPEPAGDYN